jgi:chromosome segregation ATPase
MKRHVIFQARQKEAAAEKESRRVAAELKQAHQATESAVAAAKADVSSQLLARNREVASLNKRIEGLQSELSQLRNRHDADILSRADLVGTHLRAV